MHYGLGNALDGWEAVISLAVMKVCNFRFADKTTLIGSSEEELLDELECMRDKNHARGLGQLQFTDRLIR